MKKESFGLVNTSTKMSVLTSCIIFFLAFIGNCADSCAQKFSALNANGQNIFYKVINSSNHEVSVVKSKPKYSDSSYIIPERVEYNGEFYTVTVIGEEAFEECDNIKEMILPPSIREINDDAFENCEFKSFEFPKNLKKISSTAFSWTKMGEFGEYFKYFAENKIVSPLLKGKYILSKFRLLETNDQNKTYGIITYKNNITDRVYNMFMESARGLETDSAILKACLYRAIAIDDIKSQIYIPKLSKVERTDDPEYRFSGVKEVETDSTNWYGFEDDFIDATINFKKDCFELMLKNKTSNTIKVVWDEAVYVGPDGVSSALSPGETRVIDNEKKKLPSTIIRGTSFRGILVPNCNIIEDKPIRVERLLPTNNTELADKHISLMLPIQIKDVINEYIFDFKIEFNDKIAIR